MTYKGRYRPKFPAKYAGNLANIEYRSLWERQLMRWCDENPNVESWNSEETIVPYICRTDGRQHRYFVDFFIRFSGGVEYLIEVKPASQTTPPKEPKRKTKRYINEVMTYAKNISKWEAAEEYAKDRGMHFEVWTENSLKALGIKLVLGPPGAKKK